MLNPGDKLGPYEIAFTIGKGGMGEVYRARDSRIGRNVAIKTSNESFNERFEREARAIAALNHPNICTLFDVGPNYLVMELVEGSTLADRINQGAISLEESLAIARQVADALEAAHEKGITHRDLKPGNVILKSDGSVKVLDFGLAKVSATGSSGVADENSPTLSMAATQAGVILGTAAYMAPEQARGKVVDKRADIWAFGVVLYEMVTGKRLFQGEDLTEILAKVIRDEPDLTVVPVQIRRLLQSCLKKDPKHRLRDIADVWKLLDAEIADIRPQGPVSSTKTRLVPWAIAAIALVVALVTAGGLWRASQLQDRPLVRLNVDLGPAVSLTEIPPASQTVALTPDGKKLIYVARLSNGPPRVYVQQLDQPEPVALQNTDGAASVFLSPDGQWVGFATLVGVSKISIEGGPVVPLMKTSTFAGAAWGEDHFIIISQAVAGGLFRVPEGGGEPALFLPLGAGDLAFRGPQFVMGGSGIIFTSVQTATGSDNTNLEVLSLPGKVRKTVVKGGSSALYLPSRHLVYNKRGTLFAVGFDPERLETRGSEIPVQTGVAFNPTTTFANFSFSRDGTLIYRNDAGSGSVVLSTVQWLDSAGARKPLIAMPGVYNFPRLSPDGVKLAVVTSAEGTQRLSIYDPDRGSPTALTFDGGQIQGVVWTHDGHSLVFNMANLGISSVRTDGAGKPARLLNARTALTEPSSFSPNGDYLAYMDTGSLQDIFTVRVTENGGQLQAGKPEPFLETQFWEDQPRFSRDGHWIAYRTNETNRMEVNVRAFPRPSSGEGAKIPISTAGGTQPVWSRKANELYYQSGDQIMHVRFRVDAGNFIAEPPGVWAELGGATFWDMGPDERAVITAPVKTSGAQQAPETEHHIVFLQNFFDELRRRVPVSAK